MPRWRSILLGLLIAALVACGGAVATPNQAGDTATATAPPSKSAPTGAPPLAPGTPKTAATAATVPTATRTASAGTPIPQPNGTLPAGWKVYRGPREFPIVIAYPPDWTVDTSYFPDQAVIFIYGPNGREEQEVVEIVGGMQEADANIDVLRDDFFQKKSEFCEKKGIEYTEQRKLSGATFAMLGAACEQSNDLYYLLVASGLKNGDEWSIVMRTRYERKDSVGRAIFDLMLGSLNIYALVPQ